MRKPSLLSCTVLVPPLFFTCFPSFGSSSLLIAVPVLLASAVFLVVLAKKKNGTRKAAVDLDASGQDDLLSADVAENKVSQDGEVESKGETVRHFDIMSSSSASRSGAGSDCSLTDDEEDGLIEITFQEGEPISLNNEKSRKPGEIPNSNPPDVFSDDGVFTDDEMNEEGNLIELDISMGSIKLPKFRPRNEQ